MRIGFNSVKGGQGVTTVAAIVALESAKTAETMLVPTCDTEACLGLPSGMTDPVDRLRISDVTGRFGFSDDEVLICDQSNAGLDILVTRACYISLKRAVHALERRIEVQSNYKFDGIVVVRDAGRVLNDNDVSRALGAPVIATFDVDPAVARASDAGLLCCRVPDLAAAQARRVLEACRAMTPAMV